jgi:hypothetical protein
MAAIAWTEQQPRQRAMPRRRYAGGVARGVRTYCGWVSIVVGAWFAFAGGLALLAGLSGMRRVRRLRRDGLSVWALAVPPPVAEGEQLNGEPRRTLIQ